MGLFNTFKGMDLFAQPVQLMTTQGDFKKSGAKKKRITNYGTFCGFLLSFMIVVFGVMYGFIMLKRMYEGQMEEYSSLVTINKFQYEVHGYEGNRIPMDKFKFFPSLQINIMADSKWKRN